MNALDTNILVRFLIKDDIEQCKTIYELFTECYLHNTQLFVSAVVIVETIWVLTKHYEMPRNDVIQAINDLLSLRLFMVEYHSEIASALTLGSNSKYDLSDLIIGHIAQSKGAETTLTFDKKASKSEFFTLLKNG